MIMDLQRQEQILAEAHSGDGRDKMQQAKAGHWGRDKMLNLLRSRYAFPMMKKRVERLLKCCDACQRNNSQTFKASTTLHSVQVPRKIWAKIGIDLIGKLHECNGYNYICTAVDYFSKWVEAEPLRAKTSLGVAEFLHKLQCRYGVSEIHISDQGGEFNGEVMKEYYRLTGTEHRVTSAYHPQANGLVERQNRCIEDVIRKTMEQKSDWLPLLDSVLFACRVSKHSSTGYTPYFMCYQADPVLPFQWNDALNHGESVDGGNGDGDEMSFEETVERLSQQRDQVFGKAKENIRKAQAHQAKNYNARNVGEPLFVGDKVLKLNVKRIGRKEKFLPKWLGPYTIIKVNKTGSYYLRDRHGKDMKRAVPPQQVKRYFEGWQSVPYEDEGNNLWRHIHLN